MSFSPRIDSDFYGNALRFIVGLEQSAAFDGLVHNDGRNIPTIGYGFAMVVQNATGQWAINDKIATGFVAAGMAALTQAQATSLQTIAGYLNTGNATAAQTELNRLRSGDIALPAIGTAQGEQLFRFAFSLNLDQVKTMFKTNIGNANGEFLFSSLIGTTELIAIGSLGYNNPGKLIGKNLTNALWNDDRAEAWYEIRYNSNGGDPATRNGLANRRYKESDAFGLYNEAPVEEDYKAAYRMFTRHADVIQFYEGSFPPDFANNAFPGLGTTKQISQELLSAQNYLTEKYIDLEGIGITVDWNHIQVGETLLPGHPTGTDADTLTGTQYNDLLFGETGLDTLKGGAGSDVLYGGTDADFLYGQANNDFLFGGDGDDTYYYESGGGQDVINDTDGLGRILYRDASGNLIGLTGGEKTPETDDFRSRDSAHNLHYSWDGVAGHPLLITFTDNPAGNLTIQNFKNGDLGIFLDQGLTTTLANNAQNFGTGGADSLWLLNKISWYTDGGAGNDLIIQGSSYTFDAARGSQATSGNNRLLGGAGNDWLYGGDGRDTLEGGADNDMLAGGVGADIIDGGAGDDIVLSWLNGVPSSYGYDQDNPISRPYSWASTQKDWSWEVTDFFTDPDPRVLASLFVYFAGDNGKPKVLWGDAYLEPFIDGDGIPELPQNEIIDGGSGNDFLWGYTGNDYIDGGADNDKIIGESGRDTLYGGSGNDTYVFNLGDGIDTIQEQGADLANTETNVTYRWLTQCIQRQNDLLKLAA